MELPRSQYLISDTMRPRVKICCISSVYEAKMAIDYGADALGLVSHMPSGPGVIDDNLISEIVKTIPPPIASFLLTSQIDPHRIIEQYQVANTSTIQMVDRLETRAYDVLRDRLPHVKLYNLTYKRADKIAHIIFFRSRQKT